MYMSEIDSLSIQIQAQATKANNALDNLTRKLEVLSGSLSRINSSGLTGLANGVQRLGTAMQSMNNVRTADFSRLARNIERLGTINTASLNTAASSMSHLTRAFNQLGTVSVNAQQVGELARNISRLGNKGVQNAVTNIPSLATALRNLMQTLSTAPRVSNNVIQMTNALANLASQGGRVGSASNSLIRGLNSTNAAMLRTRKNALSLAAAFGKFYANYFLIVRGIKKLWSSIESSMDYVETFNYFSVALDKIGKEFGGQFEKYGYDSAEAYANSFSSRLEELTTKMTGYSIGDNGELLSSNKIGLGLDPNQLMQFQAQVSSVTNSVGLIGETSTNVSKALSMLSSDMSSLFNVDLSTVMTNLQSGLIGQSRALYKYGIDITNTTLQQYAYQYGVEKSVSAMSQAEKMQLRMLAILDQSKVSWGDQANTINSVANQYRVFKQQIANVGRTIGNLFLPIVQKVLPYVNGLIIAVNRLLTSLGFKIHGGSWLTDIMDGISGGGAVDGLEEITDETDSLADSLGDASKNANKLKGMLQKFDELNNISTQDSDSGSGSGKGKDGSQIDLSGAIADSLADYESVWNKAVADSQNKAEEIANNIIGAFKKGDYEGIGTYISNGISNALKKINWKNTYNNARNFGTGLAQFFNGLITPDLFGTVGKTVAGSLNTAIYTTLSFGQTFDFSNLGVSIGTGITEFFKTFDFASLAETINVWVDGIKETIKKILTTTDWGQVLSGAMDFVGNLELDTIAIAIGAFAWFHGGSKLTADLFKKLIGTQIGITGATGGATVSLGVTVAVSVVVAKIGFDVGKLIGKALFPEDAEYYDEFSWKDFFSSFTDGSGWDAVKMIFEEKWAEVKARATINLMFIRDKIEETWEKISKKLKNKKLEIKTKIENIKEKVQKKWKEVTQYWTNKKALDEIKTSYENFKEKVKEKWEEVKKYWNNKSALAKVKTTYENFKEKVKEKWEEVKKYWKDKSVLAEVKTTYENFKSKVEGKWTEVTNYWTKKTGLTEITAGVSDLKGALACKWEELKKWWDNNKPSLSEITAKIKLPHLKVEWDVEGVAAKALQKLGLKGFPNFSVSYYAQGGFPDTGQLFIAREAGPELVGTMSGRTTVANNDQIIAGIEQAAYRGFMRALSESNKNTNLTIQVEGDPNGIVKVVKQADSEHFRRTGQPLFSY